MTITEDFDVGGGGGGDVDLLLLRVARTSERLYACIATQYVEVTWMNVKAGVRMGIRCERPDCSLPTRIR